MKIFAIFDSEPYPDRTITGGWHLLPVERGVILVCNPTDYVRCETHLQALGGQVFPHPLSGEPIGAISGHPAFSQASLQPSHNTYRAALLLAKHFGWPMLDPRA